MRKAIHEAEETRTEKQEVATRPHSGQQEGNQLVTTAVAYNVSRIHMEQPLLPLT